MDGKRVDLNELNTSTPTTHPETTIQDFESFTEYTAPTETAEVKKPHINLNKLKFMQPAGVDNALGVLKFELDNDQNIYLHDTNQHSLFKEKIRAFSSGWLSINYQELASWVLDLPIETIQSNIQSHKSYILKTEKIPVYIVYWPLKVKNKSVIFLNDIYHINS